MTRKDPTTAVLLSLLAPGLGQVYNGEVLRGVAIHIAMWVSLAIAAFTFWLIVPAFIPLAVVVYAVYDAKHTAEEVKYAAE